MRKPTNRVRVRLDFVLELREPVDSLPFGGAKHRDAAMEGAARALRRAEGKAGIVAVAGPGSARFALDHRPVGEKKGSRS